MLIADMMKNAQINSDTTTYMYTSTNLVDRHIYVVTTSFRTASDVIIVWLAKVWPKCSMLIAMNRKIQNSATGIDQTTKTVSNTGNIINIFNIIINQNKYAIKWKMVNQ